MNETAKIWLAGAALAAVAIGLGMWASPVPQPRAANVFLDNYEGVRIFSVDWVSLASGHWYQVETSMDGKTWRGSVKTKWTDPDPSSYWRTQFPLPPNLPGLSSMGQFRLRDITP